MSSHGPNQYCENCKSNRAQLSVHPLSDNKFQFLDPNGHPHKDKDMHSVGARASHSYCTQRRIYNQHHGNVSPPTHTPSSTRRYIPHAFFKHQACQCVSTDQRLDTFPHDENHGGMSSWATVRSATPCLQYGTLHYIVPLSSVG